MSKSILDDPYPQVKFDDTKAIKTIPHKKDVKRKKVKIKQLIDEGTEEYYNDYKK